MILIYTEKLSPRFIYIVHHIFEQMLGAKIRITTDLEEFVKSNEAKVSYAKNRIGNEFFIKNFGLLFEKGVNDTEILMDYWDEIPCFFLSKKGSLPFDILSASFYLLSRYEEYLPHFQDKDGNFLASDSLAYKHNFLEKPIVDIWVCKMKMLLLEKYPDLHLTPRKYYHTSVIEVSRAYKYKCKGFIRLVLRSFFDFFSFQWNKIKERIKVISGFEKDPYDLYQELIQFHKNENIRSVFFFLLANYSSKDRGVSLNNLKYKSLIKYVADYGIVSVLSSYESVESIKKLREERQRMINIINRPVKRFRAGYNRSFIPEVYRRLAEAEYREDFTMGYVKHLGFRAGTCTPFYFYDVGFEVQLPVLINSFYFHSQLLYEKNSEDILPKIKQIAAQIKQVNGEAITIFDNRFFSKNNVKSPFKIYKKIQKMLRC